MPTIKSLCVYCGSSNGADPQYVEAARRLGTLMAERGVRLVYGGRRVGLMGAVAHAVVAGGGAATGVIPRFIIEHEKNNPGAGELSMGLAGQEGKQGKEGSAQSEAAPPLPEFELTEVIVVEDMHERKRRMFELADGFVALPGGLGTLEETIEVVTWKKLKLHSKPVVVMNIGGYWEPLRTLVERAVSGGFAHPDSLDLFAMVDTADEVFAALAGAPEIAEEASSSRL
jgi:predicted Rossmann-fold nucleotide-binding protein